MIVGLCSVTLMLSFEHNSRGHRRKGVATHEGLIIGQKRHGIVGVKNTMVFSQRTH